VDESYKKVKRDSALAPIFCKAIPADWSPHLSILRTFSSSLMVTSGRYKGTPVAKHLQLAGMEPHLFDRWLTLFRDTCKELFEESLAEFIVKAERIAESLKIALFYRLDRPWPGGSL
jgi:hemoglobin